MLYLNTLNTLNQFIIHLNANNTKTKNNLPDLSLNLFVVVVVAKIFDLPKEEI